MTSSMPPEPLEAPPVPTLPATDWPHRQLYDAVRETLKKLPFYFSSDLLVAGVSAADLFTFNSSLGATIELEVVRALNMLRSEWDVADSYSAYSFVRRSQSFPDVVLTNTTIPNAGDVLFGLELKGWYALAQENEPSFRYKVTPAVCATPDLLVVFPWALSNVLSGSPRLFSPYIIPARYAAEYRNWHWLYEHKAVASTTIQLATANKPYPGLKTSINDEAVPDKGNNFGRFARTGLMDAYMAELFQLELQGIPLRGWQRFLSRFTLSQPDDAIEASLVGIAKDYAAKRNTLTAVDAAEIRRRLAEVARLLNTS